MTNMLNRAHRIIVEISQGNLIERLEFIGTDIKKNQNLPLLLIDRQNYYFLDRFFFFVYVPTSRILDLGQLNYKN